jgi:hypothetical protein
MIYGHGTAGEAARIAMGSAIVLVGLLALIWPGCFAGIGGYFRRAKAALTPQERARLERAIAEREAAEGLSRAYGRYLGVVTIALAALELIDSVPFIVPYALVCLASAVVTSFAYLQVRRATERRAAPLVRRAPLTALSPLVVAAMLCCFLATAALAAFPPMRLSAAIVAVAMVLLGAVAWRIAGAPALLLGDDPQWEYAVDDRVRVGRARSTAVLACAPAMVLVTLVAPSLPASYHVYASVAPVAVFVALFVSIVANAVPLARRSLAA